MFQVFSLVSYGVGYIQNRHRKHRNSPLSITVVEAAGTASLANILLPGTLASVDTVNTTAVFHKDVNYCTVLQLRVPLVLIQCQPYYQCGN